MLKSNFFALLSCDCNENFLKNSYDISFNYYLKNSFFRNVDREGGVYADGKYYINIAGKGDLGCFLEQELRFFSSELVSCFDDSRKFLVTFDEKDTQNDLFESAWKFFFKNQTINFDKKNFGFPILDMCLVSKKIKNSFWKLELIEK